jgi:hypothetical protein
MDRKHKGKFNPFHMLNPFHMPKKITYYDATTTSKNNSNSLLPDFDSKGPIQPSIQLQNLLQQIKGLSRFELVFLLKFVYNQLTR